MERFVRRPRAHAHACPPCAYAAGHDVVFQNVRRHVRAGLVSGCTAREDGGGQPEAPCLVAWTGRSWNTTGSIGKKFAEIQTLRVVSSVVH